MFRAIFAALILFASSPVFAAWNSPNSGVCPLGSNYQNQLNFCSSTYDGVTAWRMTQISTSTSTCSAGYKWQCQYWTPYGHPCTSPQVWDQSSQQCVDPDPPDCEYAGALPHPSGEGCYCPEPQIEGLANINGQLELSCIDPFPEDECPEGSHPVTFGDDSFCWEPPPPNPCPEGSLPYTMNGVDQCWTPDENNNECPPGTYKVTYAGQDSCMNPQPNIDDPDNPDNPDDPDNPNNPGDSNITVNVEFDDSRIVQRLDQANAKLDQVNTNLDEANESLTSMDENLEKLTDELTGDVGPMPGHSQATVGTFADVNSAFYSRLTSAPIVSAFGAVPNMLDISGGQCPAFEVSFDAPFSFSGSTEIHCEIWLQHAAILSAVFTFIWLFAGFRIFAGA